MIRLTNKLRQIQLMRTEQRHKDRALNGKNEATHPIGWRCCGKTGTSLNFKKRAGMEYYCETLAKTNEYELIMANIYFAL